MNPTSILILVFAGTTFLVGLVAWLIHDLFFRYRFLLRERVDNLTGKTKIDANASLFKDLKQFDADVSRARTHWRTRLQNMLEQSALKLQFVTLCWIAVGIASVLAVVAVVAFKRWWTAPIGLGLGIVLPLLYVRIKCRRRISRLARQLPEAFDSIGRAVRAGQTISVAFQIVGDDFESPICDEFRRCYEEQNLGMAHDITLRNLASRTGIMELRILVVALLVQSRSGGNLVALLSNLSTMARNRIKLQQKVRALTGEGRMQAAVLIVLPILAFVSLMILSPQYAYSLLAHPWMLFTAGAAQCVGAVWIRQIVNFEY